MTEKELLAADIGTLGSDPLCKLLLRQSFFQSCLRQLLHDALPCRQQFLFGHTKPSLPIHYNVIIYDNDCQEVRLSFQVPRFLFGRFFTLIGFTADDLVLTLIHIEQGVELISTRAGGSQCPYCSGIKLLKGFNDLKTKYPSLAAEWSEKNLSLTPDAVNEKSTKNVWWKCNTCGYEWKAVVKARVKGGMCPVCAERAVLQGYNDLGTTDPYLLSEWDYEKNSKWTPSNVSRNSMKVVWWKCGAGHSYRAKITDRTIEQKGCPQCEAEFQQALPQMLIMMYGAQNGITVKSNSDSELGMRLVAYLPELHCAVDIAGATVTEKREQSVKAHICQSNRLGYYLIKRTADASQMAAEIKTLFIRNHIYLHTDSEKDVQVLRERFLEWKYRNACKLNGKY